MTTPGGLALPFHSSVRVSLTGGKRIEHPKTQELIGIEVHARVVKDKVSRPFRKCTFEIHFGKGIVEHEQLFDEVRAYCDEHEIVRDGKKMSISGTSAWKELNVIDVKTGEAIVSKKFYKAEFGDVQRDPKYKQYVDTIVDIALTRTPEEAKKDQYDSVEVDPDGYELPQKEAS